MEAVEPDMRQYLEIIVKARLFDLNRERRDIFLKRARRILEGDEWRNEVEPLYGRASGHQ